MLKVGDLPLLGFLLCWLASLMPVLELGEPELKPQQKLLQHLKLELGLELELESFLAWESKRVQV